MPTFNTDTPKPAYVYDSSDDTWYPLAGVSAGTLDGLTDVVISSAASGQTLVYNGTNWVNTAETGDVSAVSAGTGITVTSGTGPIPTIALSDNLTLNNPILVGPEERMAVTSSSASTNTINLDTVTAGTLYFTGSASSNHVINVRHSSNTSLNNVLTTGDSITVVWLNTNGTTAYYPTRLEVDGATSGVSIKWQGGTAPSSGNASSIDAYVYNIIKTAATSYTVLASQTKFA